MRLVAHPRHHVRARPDEDEVVVLARGDERGILREEAPPRMDGFATGDLCCPERRGDVQVALRRRRRADADSSIGDARVQRALVGGRVDGDGLDAEFVQRTNDAHRDLAAVRNQDAREHQRLGRPLTGSSSMSSWPYSTGCAFSTWIARTMPGTSAFTSFISFIASRMQSVCPTETGWPSSTNGGAPGCGAR